MKFRRKTEDVKEKIQLRMAPMIDVVFLLLIFFMCATRWKATEANLPTNLPKGIESGPPPPPKDIDHIIIRVKTAGAGVSLRLNEFRCSSVEDLSRRLFLLRKELAGLDVPVIIDADRDVQFQNVITVLNTALKADFEDVSFAAPLPEG